MQHELFFARDHNDGLTGQTASSYPGQEQRAHLKGAPIAMDKLLVGTFFLVISYVVVFSWGVDRGEAKARDVGKVVIARLETDVMKLREQVRLAEEEQNQDAVPGRDKAVKSTMTEAQKGQRIQDSRDDDGPFTLVATPVSRSQSAARSEREIAHFDGGFTVQVVTYASRDLAERQIKLLERLGYQGFVIPSGKYHQVCVNRFSDKELAHTFQKRIQSETGLFADAYVRNIPSM